MITDQASALSASRNEVENFLRDNWFGTEFPCLGIYSPYPDYNRNYQENIGFIKDIIGPDGALLSLPFGFPSPKILRVKRAWRKNLLPGPVIFRLRLGPEAICLQNPFQFVAIPATLSNIDSAALTTSNYYQLYTQRQERPEWIDLKPFYDLVKKSDWPQNQSAVAIYEKSDVGRYQLSDFRTTSFIELSYPDEDKATEVIIPLPGPIPGLALNTYYQFHWKLAPDRYNPRGYKVIADRNYEFAEIDPHKQIEGFFRRRDKIENADDLTSMMKTIINELTASSDGTFIYELLQNANDYPVEVSDKEYENVDVEFYLTENYLICRHNGKFFTARDIAGVCKTGDGSKSKKKNAIGYKGIGFKTVFRDHNYVYINTGDYRFRFEEEYHGRKRRPWQIMPIWTEDDELDPEIRDIVVSGTSKYRVQTVMKPKDKSILRGGQDARKNYQYLLHDIFKSIRDIIFIPNIQSVTVHIDGEEPFVCSKANVDEWVISKAYEYKLTTIEQEEINSEIISSSEIPPKYENFEDTRVLFACEKDGFVLKAVENATVNCYLPTQAQFGFPFLMNTDMVPSGDRNELKRNIKVNEKFAYIAGTKFAEWLKDLLVEGFESTSVFDLVPDFENCRKNKGYKYSDFISAFEKGFIETLNTLPIVPVSKAGRPIEYITLKEALYDATGISAKEIMSDSELCLFTGLPDRSLPIKELRECESFKKLHNIFKENPLTVSHLLAAFNNKDFNIWLSDEDHNCNWLQYILGYREKNSFSQCAMFIDEADGTLKSSESLYLDVEKYKDDLDFFHDKIHRLSQKVFSFAHFFGLIEDLKTSYKWVSFSPSKFVSSNLLSEDTKEETIQRLKIKENSVKFVHFLASTEIDTALSSFPLFVDRGCLDSATGLLYFNGNLAQIARNKPFIKQEWFSIVLDDYLIRDKEKVEAYLKKNGVKDCTFASLYDDIVLKDVHTEDINLAIDASIDNAIDFFEFLRWDKKDLQDKELRQFHLVANDASGAMTFVSPDDDNIFFESKDFDEYLNKSWADSGWMYALHSAYFKNDTDDEDRKAFLKDKFGIKVLNPSTFFKRVIKKHLDEILKKVSAPNNEAEYDSRVDANLDFIAFVCKTASSAFADDSNPFSGKSYPFINSDGVITEGPTAFKRFYLYSDKAVSLQGLDWLPDGYVCVVSPKYLPVENPAICLTVLGKLGLVEFSPEDFLTRVVTANLTDEAMATSLSDKQRNLSFHNYFKNHRSLFSPTAMAGLSRSPIINSNGVLINSVSGQELLNEAVIAILDNPNISVSFENGGIGLEYQDGTSSENKAYWVDCLGARIIDSDRLVELLTTGDNEYSNIDVNIAFWRLIQSLGNSIGKSDIKTILQAVPIIIRAAGKEESALQTLTADTPCYIAKEYFPSISHIEDVLKDYSPDSLIVSSDYLPNDEPETKSSWFKMWEKGGFLSSNDDIILRSILPSLEIRKDDFTPQLIYENQKLFDLTQTDVLAALAKLNVKTKSGDYLPITEVYFLGEGLSEPMSYIKLSNEISESYTPTQCTFFRRIAEDVHSVHRIVSTRDWATRKVKQYLADQRPDLHDRFVKDTIDLYEASQLDFDVPFDSLLLKDKKGTFRLGTELTLGSQYGAEICDFERFGIESLHYVSDHYLKLEIKKTSIRDFFSKQVKVHREFQEEDIPLLTDNHSFAVYIWSEYIKTRYSFERMSRFVKDGVLNEAECVPSGQKVYPPSDVYNESLQEYHPYFSEADDWFVHKSIPLSISFKDGKEEQNPVFGLPLNNSLEKEHCYEVLLNTEPDSPCRNGAIARLIELHSNGEVKEDDINGYRENEKAIWLNGENEALRIDKLYGIGRDDKDKYYRRHFQTDSHIIHDELFSGLDYDAACDVLGITVLHEKHFKVVPPDHYSDETEQVVSVLKRKSILLATAIDGAQDLNCSWVDSYNGYNEDADELHFYRCENLSIECILNTEICQSDVITHYFDKNTSTFYYVYGWQDKLVFDGLVEKLCDSEALNIPCGDDFEIVKKIIDENLQGKRLVDFVKKYCAYYSKNPDFQKLFYKDYPSVAEQLGWDIIRERKVESTSYRENVAIGAESDDYETPDSNIEITQTEDSVGIHKADSIRRVDRPINDHKEVEAESSPQEEYTAPTTQESVPSRPDNPIGDNVHSEDHQTTSDVVLYDEKEEQLYPEPDLYGELGEPESNPENEPEGGVNTITPPVPLAKVEDNRGAKGEEKRQAAEEMGRKETSGPAKDSSFTTKREDSAEVKRSAGTGQWQRPKQLDNAWVSEGPSINPIQLAQSDFSDAEYETLADLLNVDREEIADQNYLARKRFWDSIREHGFETDQDEIDFIKNDYRQNGKTSRDIPLHDGRYIHRCSAAKGILYISPSIWNKVKNGRCIICVYAGKRASEFRYFDTQEQILDWVKNTAIFIQVTGQNKGEIMDKFYSGSLESRTGDFYAMIPIKTQGASDVFFTTSAADLDKASFDID